MSLYPDNVPRANRVRQLASDIAHLQRQIKSNVESARKQDADALAMLEKIAKNAGSETLDAYIDAAEKQLSPNDKADFDKMKDDVEKLDEDMAISHKVFRGLVAVGLVTKGIRIFVTALKETQSLLLGVQAILKSIYYALSGAVQTAVKLLSWGRITLSTVSRTGSVAAQSLSSMKYLRIGGNVLIGVGVLVDAVLLIHEAVEGADQREDLQKAIKELSAHRLVVQELEMKSTAILNFKSDAKSIVTMKSKYEEWVKKKRMTDEEVKEELQPEMKKIENDIKTALSKITHETVWKALDDLDTNSKIAWRTEDPSLKQILKWIEDHPSKESDENTES